MARPAKIKDLRRERQFEGIAKAKAAGVYKGRPTSIDVARVRELKAQGARRQGPRHRSGERLQGARGQRLTLHADALDLKASLTNVEMKRYPDHLGFALMDAEQKRLLQKKWRVAKAVMARACWSLPSPTSVEREQFEASVSRFHEFIQVNELGLAFEELCAAAELVDCQGSVWRDLERAAQVMGLHDKVPYLRERFRAAPIQGVRGDRRRGNAPWSRRIASHLVTWFRAPR